MKQPESIILAFSNTRNNNLKHLNPELQKIRDVLKEAEEKNRIAIIEHSGVTYNSLSYLLNSGKGKTATMLHFSGHSSKDGLWVENKNEHGILSKKPLINLIRAHKKFRFVFLNSCQSKEIAQELISAGVPYVIGTSERVNDQQAAIVAAKFYSLLSNGDKTIEEAFLLTKDYINDPFNDNDSNIKDGFRTFALLEDDTDEYPWQLYQNTELKTEDKDWVLNPGTSSTKRRAVYISIGIIGLLIVLYTAMMVNKLSGKRTDAVSNADTSASSEKIGQAKNIDSVKKAMEQAGRKLNQPVNGSRADDQNIKTPTKKQEAEIKVRHESTAPTVKKSFAQVRIVDSANNYNDDVSGRATNIFSNKGLVFEDAGADLSAGNVENLVAGEIILSPPVKTEGPFSTIVLNYYVRLSLRFSDGEGKRTCGKKEYSAKVSTAESDTKERVLRQGINDVLDQLQKDNNFPFCVKK